MLSMRRSDSTVFLCGRTVSRLHGEADAWFCAVRRAICLGDSSVAAILALAFCEGVYHG